MRLYSKFESILPSRCGGKALHAIDSTFFGSRWTPPCCCSHVPNPWWCPSTLSTLIELVKGSYSIAHPDWRTINHLRIRFENNLVAHVQRAHHLQHRDFWPHKKHNADNKAKGYYIYSAHEVSMPCFLTTSELLFRGRTRDTIMRTFSIGG